MPQNKKETISFKATITAGTSGQELVRIINQPATVEHIFGRFYPGQQNTLQVRPQIETARGQREDLVTYPSETNLYISGDDQNFDLPVSFDVQNYDKIIVHVSNTSSYDYTLDISFVVDYQAGTSRA